MLSVPVQRVTLPMDSSTMDTDIPLIERFCHAASAINHAKSDITQSLAAPVGVMDPQQLSRIQAKLGDYSTAITLVSTVASKFVRTVETVCKS